MLDLSLPDNSIPDPGNSTVVEPAWNNDHHIFEMLHQRHIGRVFAVRVRLLKDKDGVEAISEVIFGRSPSVNVVKLVCSMKLVRYDLFCFIAGLEQRSQCLRI